MKDFECKYCGRHNFNSKSGYTLHIKSCKGKDPKKLECDRCGQSFSSTSGLTLHMKTCGGKTQGPRKDSMTGKMITERPKGCKCPTDVKVVLECALGTGCWIDGWGWCQWASKEKESA